MGLNTTTYVLSKGYTKNTADSLGAVKGAPATIKSITEIDGGHRVTFEWTGTSGTKQTSTLDVMNGVNGTDGKDGKNGAKGAKGDPGQNGQDGTNGQDGIGISKIEKTKTEGLVDTYVITFSDDSTFEYTVTNGKDGKNGTGSSTGEENVIESIKVNGVAQTVAEDKSVDITVPTVDVDKNYVDIELSKKANISDIPSLDGYVTDEELNAKGYLTSHQDVSGKVDKVKGKSLIADTEIERLKSVKNYDDTEIKTELVKKANSTDVTKEISDKIAEVISDAPESFNTLKEISDWISGHENDASAMNSAIKDNKSAITTLQTGKADKTEIPTVPTNVSEFTNDAGYLTEHQDISNLVVKEEGKGLSSNDYTSEEKTKLGGVGTSQGRNLISYPYYNGTSYESNGVTYTVNEVDGTITVNGTATKESDFRLISPYDTSDRKTLELGQTYTLSDGVNQPNTSGYQAPVYFQFVRIDATKNDFNYGISTNYGNMTWTASDANLLQYGIRIVVRSGVTVDNVVLKPMLEIGAIAHSYEPTTENNISLKKSIETKATINDTSTTSTTETWSAKKINEKTAQNFDKRIILSVGRGTSGEYTDTANLNSAYGAYLYWASTVGQDQYSVGVILYVNKGWMIIPIKETDGGTNITFSINGSILTMTKSSSTFPSAGGVIALGSSI